MLCVLTKFKKINKNGGVMNEFGIKKRSWMATRTQKEIVLITTRILLRKMITRINQKQRYFTPKGLCFIARVSLNNE